MRFLAGCLAQPAKGRAVLAGIDEGFFATREMLKRLYRLIHERHQDGYLVNHMSFNTLIPTMSQPAASPRTRSGSKSSLWSKSRKG